MHLLDGVGLTLVHQCVVIHLSMGLLAHPEKSGIWIFHLGESSISGVGVAQPKCKEGSHQNNPAMHLGGLRPENFIPQ